jgi:hypothetical protein
MKLSFVKIRPIPGLRSGVVDSMRVGIGDRVSVGGNQTVVGVGVRVGVCVCVAAIGIGLVGRHALSR